MENNLIYFFSLSQVKCQQKEIQTRITWEKERERIRKEVAILREKRDQEKKKEQERERLQSFAHMVSSRWRTKTGAFYPVKTWRDHIESGGVDGSEYVHVGTLVRTCSPTLDDILLFDGPF